MADRFDEIARNLLGAMEGMPIRRAIIRNIGTDDEHTEILPDEKLTLTDIVADALRKVAKEEREMAGADHKEALRLLREALNNLRAFRSPAEIMNEIEAFLKRVEQ